MGAPGDGAGGSATAGSASLANGPTPPAPAAPASGSASAPMAARSTARAMLGGRAPASGDLELVVATAAPAAPTWSNCALRGDPASPRATVGAFGHDEARSRDSRVGRRSGSVTIRANNANASASAAPSAAPLAIREPVGLSATRDRSARDGPSAARRLAPRRRNRGEATLRAR
jgi:hypothetical protein